MVDAMIPTVQEIFTKDIPPSVTIVDKTDSGNHDLHTKEETWRKSWPWGFLRKITFIFLFEEVKMQDKAGRSEEQDVQNKSGIELRD